MEADFPATPDKVQFQIFKAITTYDFMPVDTVTKNLRGPIQQLNFDGSKRKGGCVWTGQTINGCMDSTCQLDSRLCFEFILNPSPRKATVNTYKTFFWTEFDKSSRRTTEWKLVEQMNQAGRPWILQPSGHGWCQEPSLLLTVYHFRYVCGYVAVAVVCAFVVVVVVVAAIVQH